MTTIDFVTFKNYLSKKKILLFDMEYRIAHFRYNKLVKTNNNSQIGGGSNILKSIKNNMLNHFVNALVDNNTMKIEWILNH